MCTLTSQVRKGMKSSWIHSQSYTADVGGLRRNTKSGRFAHSWNGKRSIFSETNTHPHQVESAMQLNFWKRPSTKSPSIHLIALAGLTIFLLCGDKGNTSWHIHDTIHFLIGRKHEFTSILDSSEIASAVSYRLKDKSWPWANGRNKEMGKFHCFMPHAPPSMKKNKKTKKFRFNASTGLSHFLLLFTQWIIKNVTKSTFRGTRPQHSTP